jgi:hypothetical protein
VYLENAYEQSKEMELESEEMTCMQKRTKNSKTKNPSLIDFILTAS